MVIPRPLVAMAPHTTRRYAGPAPLAFSPDGSSLAFVSPKNGPSIVCEVAVVRNTVPALRDLITIDGASAYGLAWAPTGELYCSADRGGTECWQVYMRAADGKIEPFATSEGEMVQHHLSHNSVAPNGKTVALSSNARAAGDVDVVLVEAGTQRQKGIVSAPAWHVACGWSPDGRWLSVMRVAQNTDQDVMAVDPNSGETIELTPHDGEMQNVAAGWLADGRLLVISDRDSDFLHLDAIDVNRGSRTVWQATDWDVELAVTSLNGRAVFWSLNEDGYSRVCWRYEDGPAAGHLIDGICADAVLSHDGLRAAYTRVPIKGPAEIRIVDLSSGDDWLLLRGDPILDDDVPVPESIRIPGPEGAIPCFVYRPNVDGPCPAVLCIHGGPEGQSRPKLMLHLLVELATHGIALVVPNIHGSTGYGRAWQRRIHHDWGGIDLEDLRAVAEWMTADPGFDAHRFGVFGGSYGGFATLMCVTRLPGYWRCAAELMGPANLVTMLENAAPNWRRWNRLWIGDPEKDREKLMERSPITYIESVQCPLLVIQGANDPRVPAEESDQVVDRLRALGRDVNYISLQGEGHGLRQRQNQQMVYETALTFFRQHLTS